MPTRLIASRYALGDALGRGGMGTVWRAEDLSLERPVAVKEVYQGGSEQLLREGRAAARLNHPGAVTVFDVLEEDGNAYLVMELVEAVNLSELVGRDGPLAAARAAAVGIALVDALAAAHAQGIVHRDVKPANVLVRPDGRVKLGDFGIAAGADLSNITMTGMVLGSPNYMSPEQAQGLRDVVGPATDVWSLGATLYFAVEGLPPFARTESIAVLAAVVGSPPRPPVLAGPLAPLLLALLAKDPATRPSLAEVRRQLATVAAVAAAPADPPSATPATPGARPTPAPAPAPAASPPPAPAAAAPPAPAASPAPAAIPGPPPAFSAPLPAPGTGDGAKNDGAKNGGGARRSGRRRGPILVAVCAVVVVLLVAIAVAARPGRHAGHTDTHSATPPTTAAGGASTAPAGWVGYRDPATGFTIAYPSGWTVSRNGSFTDFRDPASARSLRVDWTATPGPSAEAAWRSLAASFGPAHAGYAEIGIAPTTYKGMPAATWEFAYDQGSTRFHNVDLGMVTGRYGFALDFQTADGDWAASQPVFQAFQGTFAAAR